MNVPKHKLQNKKRGSNNAKKGSKKAMNSRKLKKILNGVNLDLGDLPKMTKISNKMKRSEVFARRKKAKNMIKSQERQKRKREQELLGDKAPPVKIPKTIDDMKIPNETMVEENDQEVEEDEQNDEFAEYFDGRIPKIMMTSSRRPSAVKSKEEKKKFPSFLNFFLFKKKKKKQKKKTNRN